MDCLAQAAYTAEGPQIQSVSRTMLGFEELDRLNTAVQSYFGHAPPEPILIPAWAGTTFAPAFERGRSVYQPGFRSSFMAYFGLVFDTPVIPTVFYER